ncbi:hypothetical protein [Paraburkholderia kirstenboschensis]|uniref:VIT family protein n=1 Tax=Paraburkholderia kirstenboschensis TaxID=1245436 RepID=A0ABZ0EH95_9BURK|nr:hypothetical protein [Paraburkholderia kirstenboschensis]WOD15577.1 hypothetical protein RW095_20105 [Paraburkholderia kirstenboschensis]
MSSLKLSRLLDPIDRVSEVLFGLIMAITIVGSLSIGTGGHEQARAATAAALGCNVAWGLVDAVMYLVRTTTERMHNRSLAAQIVGADSDLGLTLIKESLPAYVAAITGPQELAGMRRRVMALSFDGHRILKLQDIAAAAAIFLLVVIATFPLVLPFLLTRDTQIAVHASRVTAVILLFIAGWALGRYAGHGRPFLTGAVMAGLGVVLIGSVMALGG